MNELRLAVRRLTRQRSVTAAAVVTLACSIAATAATWSLLSAVLLRPLRVSSADRLIVVGQVRTLTGRPPTVDDGHVYPVYARLRESRIFDAVAAGGSFSLFASTANEPAVPRDVCFASHDFFSVLGVRLPLGRSFTPDEDRPGTALVTVLSDRTWRTAFDADPDVVGKRLTVSGQRVTVVGVAPRSFRGLDLASPPDLYMPLHAVADVGNQMANYFSAPGHASSPSAWVRVIARLPANVTAAQAEAKLQVFFAAAPLDADDIAARFTQSMRVRLTSVNTAAIAEAGRPAMARLGTLLGATVAMLMLIGCSTVGMLLLIRTEARRQEFAVCLALGASRVRLASSVALESLLLAAAGTVLAVPVARWLLAGVRGLQLPGGIDVEALDLGVDAGVLAAGAGCAALLTLLVALAASHIGFSASVADAIGWRGGSASRSPSRPTRTLLVTGQVAVALVLVGGAGLFARSVSAALSLNPGFDTTRIVTGSVSLGPHGYDAVRAASFFEDLGSRLRTNPAIRSVSTITSDSGMGAGGQLIVDTQRRSFASGVGFVAIDDRYFEAMGVRVTRGRNFTVDDREGSALVAIVSESFGRAIAGGGDPLGHTVTMPFRRINRPADVVQIVGVVPDLITTVSDLQPLRMYRPLAQSGTSTGRTVVVRATSGADAARRAVLGTIRQMDRLITVRPMLTIDERLAEQMGPQRLGAAVMGGLGFVAALLAALGSYVVAETTAVLRRREMGIRAALGARGTQLARMVLLQTGRLVGAGLVLGLGVAWLGTGTIRALLFRTAPLDPLILGGVAGLILLVSLAVSLKPALRTARVDLAGVLREE